MQIKKETYVYRVMLQNEWNEFKTKKKFFGNKLDLDSGYIHLSTKAQLRKTIEKYYYKKNDIVILKIDLKNIEKILNGKFQETIKFFHLYGFIDFVNVKGIVQKI